MNWKGVFVALAVVVALDIAWINLAHDQFFSWGWAVVACIGFVIPFFVGELYER